MFWKIPTFVSGSASCCKPFLAEVDVTVTKALLCSNKKSVVPSSSGFV